MTLEELPLDAVDRAIVNRLQRGVAVSERPFAAIAAELALDETVLVKRLNALLAEGVLTRFGPMYNAERLGGAFTLAAMAVPEAQFDRVADLVNAYPEVAHNYRRDHELNMWFVLACDDPQRIAAVIAEIERDTGLAVIDLPKLEEFYVGLFFAV